MSDTYNYLNPCGIWPTIDAKPLASRLDSLDGKTIYVNQGEADPVIMPALYERLKTTYPKTTWRLIATSGFGPWELSKEEVAEADATIRGVGW